MSDPQTLPDTFAAIIDLWPSAAELGRDIDVKDVTVRQWKSRGIPGEYWVGIVASAQSRNIEGVTFDRLAKLSALQSGRAAA